MLDVHVQTLKTKVVSLIFKLNFPWRSIFSTVCIIQKTFHKQKYSSVSLIKRSVHVEVCVGLHNYMLTYSTFTVVGMEARRSHLITDDTWSPSLNTLGYLTTLYTQSNIVFATRPGLSVKLARKQYKNSTSVLFTLWRNKALACLTQVEKLIRRDYLFNWSN